MASYSQMAADAQTLELQDDLEGALRLWYAMEGMAPITSVSKDGHSITFSESMIAVKIARLEARINRAAGRGKMKRVDVQHDRTGGPTGTIYDDGYAWGY